MNFCDVINNQADQDKGREFELVDPFTGAPSGLKLWIVGPDSQTARRADLAFSDELIELADSDGRVSAENRRKARLNALARRVLRWDVKDGEDPIPFNQSNLLKLLGVGWIEEQIDAIAGDRRRFANAAHVQELTGAA